MLRPTFLTLLCLCCCAAEENRLYGSISEDFSLDFDSVDIVVAGCSLRIDYVKEYPVATYIPCRVKVDAAEVTLSSGSTIKKDAFDDAVLVSRVTPTGRQFPDVESGSVHFSEFHLTAGETVEGQFHVVFDDGRDLSGRFSGDARDAQPDTVCEAY
jgi:hypothetical protein